MAFKDTYGILKLIAIEDVEEDINNIFNAKFIDYLNQTTLAEKTINHPRDHNAENNILIEN